MTDVGQPPNLSAACQDTANSQLWNSATLKVTTDESIVEGSLSAGYDFVITMKGDGTVDCELTNTDPSRPAGSSGTWTGDDN